MRIAGQPLPHESASGHVTGAALYTDDLVGRFPGILHAWPVLSPHAHAFVVRLDAAPAMQEGLHPDYPAARVTCACGNTFVTRSTRGDFQVDVCSACHPFYTGTQKLIDTAGRVDRFRRRYEKKVMPGAKVETKAEPKADPPADAK